MKTTPKPRATKNSKGELGPPLPLESDVGLGVDVASVGVEPNDDIVVVMFAIVLCQYPTAGCEGQKNVDTDEYIG